MPQMRALLYSNAPFHSDLATQLEEGSLRMNCKARGSLCSPVSGGAAAYNMLGAEIPF